MAKTINKKIQNWIINSLKPMLAANDGAVYYYPIKGGISFMLAWIPYNVEEENKFSDGKYTIEASVRKSGSSHLVEDWAYIGKGVTLQTVDKTNRFAAITDYILNIARHYLKSEIHYTLPNNVRIELLSEMRLANFDFGDFEEAIADLRKSYYETNIEDEIKTIEQKIDKQCFAFADFLGSQYEEIQTMIGIGNLSNQIKQTLISA